MYSIRRGIRIKKSYLNSYVKTCTKNIRASFKKGRLSFFIPDILYRGDV